MSVYTRVTKEALTHFLEHYDIGEVTAFTGITAGMENTNYALDTTRGRFILTIYEHYTTSQLGFFLDLMTHFSTHFSTQSSHPVKSITPVKDKAGTYLHSLCNKPAALIERLAGTALSPSKVSVEHCKIIGEALANFHIAGTSFKQFRKHDREQDLAPQLIEKIAPQLSKKDRQLLQQEITLKQSIDWSDLPSGIIHADLFCDNSIFYTHNNKPVLSGIIDLYLACNDAFIYDIAIVVNDWCCQPDSTLDDNRWLTLLRAYNKIRTITDKEKHVWIAMLRLSNLRFWVSRLDIKHFPPEGDKVMQKDPDELKHKLLACIRDQYTIEEKIMSIGWKDSEESNYDVVR